MIRKKTWALAMNATHARIVRGLELTGAGRPAELVLRTENRHLKDIMADRPGRSFTSMDGGPRSAMAYAADPIREDQREFVRQVVRMLEAHRLAGDFDALAVCAAPAVTCLLRDEMPSRLAATILGEISRNVMHLPAHELALVIRDNIAL
jgi:protein required for attachment to host cells